VVRRWLIAALLVFVPSIVVAQPYATSPGDGTPCSGPSAGINPGCSVVAGPIVPVSYYGPGDLAGASAAYMLSGYSASTQNATQVVNLRRGSDNATSDFGISNGSLNQTAIATFGGTFATGTGSSSGTTFTFTGTLLAGMQVDPTGAVGYLPGTLIISGASPTWTINQSQTVGSATVSVANDLHVTKVYDQTGNTTGAIQNTAANQPFFAVNAINGKCAMWFNNDGGLVLTATAGNIWATGGWAVATVNYVGTAANTVRLFDWGAAGTPRFQFAGVSDAHMIFFQGTSATNGSWTTSNQLSNGSHILDASFSQAALATAPVINWDGTAQTFGSSTEAQDRP